MVVIVVKAFAKHQPPGEKVIAAIVWGGMILVANPMAKRVVDVGHFLAGQDSYESSPEQSTG